MLINISKCKAINFLNIPLGFGVTFATCLLLLLFVVYCAKMDSSIKNLSRLNNTRKKKKETNKLHSMKIKINKIK